MAWKITSKRFAQFAVLALMAGEVSYAAAEVLVLRSVGPSASRYKAGQRLPDNTTFALRPSDMVVVLAGGSTRTFRGPGTFSASGPVRGGLASATGGRRATGAVRGGPDGAGAVKRPSDVWHLDVTNPGRACIPQGLQPTLWRPDASTDVQLTITPQSGAAQTINWAANQKTLAWPSSIPVTNGESYQLSWSGAVSPTRLTARVVPPVGAEDVEGLAMALIDNQCRGQLDVLIAQREAGEDTAAAGGGGGATP